MHYGNNQLIIRWLACDFMLTVFQTNQADWKVIHVTKYCEQWNPGIGWKGLRFQEGSNSRLFDQQSSAQPTSTL